MNNESRLFYFNKEYLAYNKYSSKNSNNKPGLIFLGGFKSDMSGTKAEAIAGFAKEHDYDLIRFDYFGHGKSSGKFIDGTIGLWLENSLTIIDQLTNKPQILIGSSMGGWMMLLAALARPEKIVGLVGLAAAPDFTEELIWEFLSYEQKQKIEEDKMIDFNNEFCDEPYPISLQLIKEARAHLLLNKEEIPIHSPIRLIHGMDDKDVPYSTSIRIAEQVTSRDVSVNLIKNAGHRLSQPEELEVIYKTILSMPCP